MNRDKIITEISNLMEAEGMTLDEMSEVLGTMKLGIDQSIAKFDGNTIPQDITIKTHGIEPTGEWVSPGLTDRQMGEVREIVRMEIEGLRLKGIDKMEAPQSDG